MPSAEITAIGPAPPPENETVSPGSRPEPTGRRGPPQRRAHRHPAAPAADPHRQNVVAGGQFVPSGPAVTEVVSVVIAATGTGVPVARA